MLEKLFNDDSCQRLLAGPMGPHLGALSSKLAELGYCESRARKVVCTAAALGDWLAERGLTPAEAGRAELKAYIKAQKRLPSETWLGSRDHALLLALYNTGARSSEMTGATRGQVSFGSTALFQLHGKGRKERTVPLWPQTARVLHRWFQMVEGDDRTLAFPSIRGTALSADALDYLLQCAVKKASTTCPDLAAKRVTPHVMRHTTAMHLLQSGVDIAVVAPWLGHESIGTTHGYVEADLEAKQRALDKLTPASGKVSRFKAGDSLFAVPCKAAGGWFARAWATPVAAAGILRDPPEPSFSRPSGSSQGCRSSSIAGVSGFDPSRVFWVQWKKREHSPANGDP